jgi:hypothetical protein
MSDGQKPRIPGSAGDTAKAERLAAALRVNLKRRKSQARAQSGPAPSARDDADIVENPQKTGE